TASSATSAAAPAAAASTAAAPASAALEASASAAATTLEALATRLAAGAVHAGSPPVPHATEGAGASRRLPSAELSPASELAGLTSSGLSATELASTAELASLRASPTERALLHAATSHLLPSLRGPSAECVARLHVAGAGLVEALLRRGVAILCAFAMLGLVLPPATIALAAIGLATIALPTITLPTIALVVLDALICDIRAVHALGEVVVVVRVDVHVAAAPVAVAPDRGARGHAEAEGQECGT